MISSTRSGSSAPCGCGGAHASTTVSVNPSGCGCGCGGHCGCGTADCRDGAIVRPRFFAGQLLTEEDLQALSGYVAAKSRLHNRDLFGEGVICGFEVAGHPCGGGKVIVRPGHALDCCGNDIVLSAAQTLDVNALVRDLRQRLRGGIDCGDPCAEPGHGEPRQRYCLYVHYCESLTEPVSAFVTDEPCGTAACEPTRVREGLRFELRCRDKEKPFAAVIADLEAVDHVIQQAEEGIAIERRNLPFNLVELLASKDALVAATPTDPETHPSGLALRNLVARMDVLRVHLDRFNRLVQKPPIADVLSAIQDALDRGAAKIVASVRDLLANDPDALRVTLLERSFIRRFVQLAEAAFNTAADTALVLWPFKSDEVPDVGDQLELALCALAERLRDRLDGIPGTTVCQLRAEVDRLLTLLCLAPNMPRDLRDLIDPARRLLDAWRHFLQECGGPNLLSPCPSCDDPGVLLACLEVEKCEVVRISTLERSFVPTAAALKTFIGLLQLVADRESWDLQLATNAALALEHPLELQTVAAEAASAPSDLAGLRRELAEQVAKNAELEKRVKALEGRKKP